MRVPRAWGDGGEGMAAAAAMAAPWPEAAVIEEDTLDAQIAAMARELPARPLVLGGCCCSHVGAVRELARRHHRIAVVWFDAHGDLNTPESSPSGHFHGMVLRTLLGAGPSEYVRQIRRPLQPSQIVLAGTRDLDPPERDYITRAGIVVCTPEQLADAGHVVNCVRARGFGRVYVHLDLDCFRPEDVPDALIPTRGGPSIATVAAAIGALAAACDVVGFSIVEYVDRGGGSLDRLREIARIAPHGAGGGRCGREIVGKEMGTGNNEGAVD